MVRLDSVELGNRNREPETKNQNTMSKRHGANPNLGQVRKYKRSGTCRNDIYRVDT